MPRKLLAVYLNDHLAGATLGLELVRRTARENTDSTLGSFLADVLLPEIEQDRRTLQRLMGQIGSPHQGRRLWPRGWLKSSGG